ncbi:hypothetical protein C5U48_02595 [Mycolicibacter virginiensis]|uniref:Uncharacterized protein n=1 Tax=Mycolicibacter virginiensis TaxID=1795032 RepID=A0A9X7IQW7_9MYCO|nr:hypothetical protein [Mycolicibacter virginiensis]PQM53718.1 hypothetical protein C5U48_02595 [Mycolicibacter virginiensis]
MSDEIKINDYKRYNAAVERLDAAHAPLLEIAAETRQLAEETAAGAATATGSVAAATAAFLTALAGSMTVSADAADAAHAHLRRTTFNMRNWNGEMEEIQECGAASTSAVPSR